MKSIFKKPVIIGLLLSILYALAEWIEAVANTREFNFKMLIVPLTLALTGWVGSTFTGEKYTSIGLILSALLNAIPLLLTGSIDWIVFASTVGSKILAILIGELSKLNSNNTYRTSTDPIVRPDKPTPPFG